MMEWDVVEDDWNLSCEELDMLEKDALRQIEERKSSSAASTFCPPPPHHASPSSSSFTSFPANPHQVGRFPPPLSTVTNFYRSDFFFYKKKNCFIAHIFNRRQDLSLLLSCIGLNHEMRPVSPPSCRCSGFYFLQRYSAFLLDTPCSSSFFFYFRLFLKIIFSFRVAVKDAVTDLPNLCVKLFLHSSGNITAKFAYHQVLFSVLLF